MNVDVPLIGDFHFNGHKLLAEHPACAEALAKLDDILATGTTNVDVGCMQLNWKWHSEAFASRADMLDPVQNTAYAARFLKELKNQLGSWELATAAYHSTDPDRGQAYVAKVSAAQETMIALLPTLPEGQAPAVLLSAVPVRLQGLLALAGSPMFTAAAERAALVGARTVEAATSLATDPGRPELAPPELAPPAFAPGEDDPDLPLVDAAPPGAEPQFGQGHEVGVVVDGDRHPNAGGGRGGQSVGPAVVVARVFEGKVTKPLRERISDGVLISSSL